MGGVGTYTALHIRRGDFQYNEGAFAFAYMKQAIDGCYSQDSGK